MKNLIIHPTDASTDFLKPIYENISDAIILNGGATKDQVKELITRHDRVIMLGHGSPFGLFSIGQFMGSNGYIIDSTMVDVLKHVECISIWCNADQFMNRHQLNGFYSGMFISEVGEAEYCGLPDTEQTIVDESNDTFATILGNVINKPLREMYKNTRHEYKLLAKNNPVALYNYERLYLN